MDQDQLDRATEVAARALGARGMAARADGATLSCASASGTRIIARNSLRRTPDFAEAALLDQIAQQIVRALVAEPGEAN